MGRRIIVALGIAGILIPINGYGQAITSLSPPELLSTDPRAFAEWLETERPKAVPAQDRAQILGTLPTKGEVTNLE